MVFNLCLYVDVCCCLRGEIKIYKTQTFDSTLMSKNLWNAINYQSSIFNLKYCFTSNIHHFTYKIHQFTCMFHIRLLDRSQSVAEKQREICQSDVWCKAPVKLSPPTYQYPICLQAGCLPVAQPTMSEHWRKNLYETIRKKCIRDELTVIIQIKQHLRRLHVRFCSLPTSRLWPATGSSSVMGTLQIHIWYNKTSQYTIINYTGRIRCGFKLTVTVISIN